MENLIKVCEGIEAVYNETLNKLKQLFCSPNEEMLKELEKFVNTTFKKGGKNG